MPKVTPEQNRAYYRANLEERKLYVRNRQKDIRKQVQKYKLEVGCSRCGYNKSARALQFHHLDGNEKSGNIAKWSAQGRAIDTIFAEAKKCIVLCANCHFEEHEHLDDT